MGFTSIKREKKMLKIKKFRFNPANLDYEKQANEQGFTFNGADGFLKELFRGVLLAYNFGCITKREYKRIVKRCCFLAFGTFLERKK